MSKIELSDTDKSIPVRIWLNYNDEDHYTDWNSGWRITDDFIDHLSENGYLPE